MQAVHSAVDALHGTKLCEHIGLTCREYIHIDEIRVSKIIGVEEEPKEEKPPSGITFIHLGEIRTPGYPREFFEYRVQVICHTKDFGFNFCFYVGMIVTKHIKSVEYVDVELLQRYPIGLELIPSDIGAKPRFRLSEG